MFSTGKAFIGVMTNGLHHRDGDIDACERGTQASTNHINGQSYFY